MQRFLLSVQQGSPLGRFQVSFRGAFRVTGEVPVARQLAQDVVQLRLEHTLENAGEAAMPPDSLSVIDAVVDRLLNEVMRKRELELTDGGLANEAVVEQFR
ncbi:MAG: hypothetical protein JO113_01520 [Candidatus Eremiobacteraeota bacterium]|nr:hypothetical protein [Candidatus Eremiobacteraeota bacterium]